MLRKSSGQNVAVATLASLPSRPSARLARHVLQKLIGPLAVGELTVETPDGARFTLRASQAGPRAQLSIHRWRTLGRVLAAADIGLAESYIAGEWSTPDLVALLSLGCRNPMLGMPRSAWPVVRLWNRLRHAQNRNSRRGSRRNISAHYDLGNDFYEPWLDPGMNYSSAWFESPAETLEQAQARKLDRVVELLDMEGAQHVLEIGCGWGPFADRLLAGTNARITGLTLSQEQLAHARQRLGTAIDNGRCELRLQDYRDVEGQFDRIVSIEMLEAVGEAYWPTFFQVLQRRLQPGGCAVIQVITIADDRFESYRRQPDFIQTHVFPGGMLPTQSIIEGQARLAGLEPVNTRLFGESYAQTLEIWRTRFHAACRRNPAFGFDRRFRRMWDYYLAYCQAGFATGALNVGLYKLVRPKT